MHSHDSDNAPKATVATAMRPQDAPIVCDLSAIPADERSAHIALARRLFADHPARATDDGVEVVLPADRLGDAAAFIRNERLCCRHLAFTIHVPARDASITVGVMGPGAWDELRALIR